MVSRVVLLSLLVVLFSSFVSAHFVCGVVESSSNLSSSWLSVNAYFPSNSSAFSSCEVSPDGGKYCCDTTLIPPFDWEPGMVVEVSLFDASLGLVAGPVSKVTSGEGYDVMPSLVLREVLTVENLSSVVVDGNLSFVVRSLPPFSSLSVIVGNSSFSCSSCSFLPVSVLLPPGLVNVSVSSFDGSRFLNRSFSVRVLDSFVVDRSFSCRGCDGVNIKQSRDVAVSLGFSFSGNVSGRVFREFVPSSWDVLDAGGAVVREYSSSHQVLEWVLDGSSSLSYTVRSPRLWFLPRYYVFRSTLDDRLVSQDSVFVYRFLKFFSRNSRFEEFRFSSRSPRIDPSHPLVVNVSSVRVALFPSSQVFDASLVLDSEVRGDSLFLYPKSNLPFSVVDRFFVSVDNVSSIRSVVVHSRFGSFDLPVVGGRFESFVSSFDSVEVVSYSDSFWSWLF